MTAARTTYYSLVGGQLVPQYDPAHPPSNNSLLLFGTPTSNNLGSRILQFAAKVSF